MWEASETILLHVKGDVLVIFDCCDAGSLAKLRSAGRVFEYLGACEAGKSTHRPGKHSFTSALTWALEEMKSEPPFTTDVLVSKIKEYKWLPKGQSPALFPRRDFMPEHIWISGRRTLATPTLSRRRSSSVPEFRDENCDYVDFRVTFSRPLSDGDGKAVADLMEPLVGNKKLPLNARHVSFLRKGTCKPSENSIARWARVRNHLVAVRRFQGPLEGSGALPIRKRKRLSLEAELEDHHQMQYSKSASVLGSNHATKPSTISSSEDQDSDSEETLGACLDTTMETLPRILHLPYEMESDSLDQVKAVCKDLERLKQDASLQPELHSFLQSQIRAMLVEEA